MSIWKNQRFAAAHSQLARHTDKPTSHQAADHMVESGKLEGQMEEVNQLVKLHPHCTAFELADFSTLDRYQIARRTADLAAIGKIKASEAGRRCSKSNRMACTWSAV